MGGREGKIQGRTPTRHGTLRAISSSQIFAFASDGIRQSPRGLSDPPRTTFGPFGSAAEAQDSPAVLVEYARAWLDSEESEPFREMAAELDDGADYTYD